MNKALAATALLLSGCALTPQEVVSTGSRYTTVLAQPPESAAYCIERNAENAGPGNIGTHRPLSDESGIEVIVRSTGETTTTLFVAKVRPTSPAGGSTAEVWIAPIVLSDHAALAERFYSGC